MKPQNSIYILALLLLGTYIHAQDLHLTYAGKKVTFKTGSFVEILLPSDGIAPCEKCSHNLVRGKLISYRNDVLTLRLYEKGELLATDGKVYGHQEITYEDTSAIPVLEIAKSDIMSIKQSGKKKLKEHTTGETIATIIGILGAGHLASIPLAEESAGLLAIVGASELVLAFIIGPLSVSNTYKTNVKCPGYPKNPEEIWILD